MTASEALEKILPSYGQYYTVRREDAAAPFAAEAFSTVQDVYYAAFRSVKLSEAASNEWIFFAVADHLSGEEAARYGEAAWAEGQRRVEPGPNHRSTNIVLVILADTVSPEAAAYIKKLHRSKSYKLMFHGWSNYMAIVIETSSGKMTSNRLGQPLKKLFGNIIITE